MYFSEVMQEVNEFYFDNFYILKGVLKYKLIKEYSVEYNYFEGVINNNDNFVIWIKMIFLELLIF